MTHRLLTFAAVLAISCHTPTAAQTPQDSADTSQHRLVLETDDTATLATIEPYVSHEPAGESLALCCDIPSGLCFAGASGDCVSVTSRAVSCPVDRVRGLPAVDALVCAR